MARVPSPHGSPPLDEPLNPLSGTDPASAPRSEPAPPPVEPLPEAPGLGEQIGATRDSAKRLLTAHIELAKAEASDIADAAKRAAAFVGIAVAAGLVAALIITVGLPLFIGEAVFGSMGWGILMGVLLLAAVALAAVVAGLRPGVQASIGGPFIVAVIVGIVVGVVLGLDLTNRAWSTLADAAVPGVGADVRPLVVAVVALAVIGGVIGLIVGLMSGSGSAAIGGLVGGAVGGVLLGALTAIAPGPRVGAALGVTVGLITWTALMGAGVARGGFDSDALKARFWPARTIETTKETIEWARERMPLSRKS